MPRDHYEVLGVPRTATHDEIRSAFRKIAMRCHPDRNPGNADAEADFKAAAAAWEVLGDPTKRQLYDWGDREEAASKLGWRDFFERVTRGIFEDAADRVAAHAADELTGAGRMTALPKGRAIVRPLPCANGQVCVEVRCRLDDVSRSRKRAEILAAVEEALLEG